jgi:hypothetical protein
VRIVNAHRLSDVGECAVKFAHAIPGDAAIDVSTGKFRIEPDQRNNRFAFCLIIFTSPISRQAAVKFRVGYGLLRVPMARSIGSTVPTMLLF